jgi:hypothetical protein
VAETNGLLNRRTGKSGTEGSNPSVSANRTFTYSVQNIQIKRIGLSQEFPILPFNHACSGVVFIQMFFDDPQIFAIGSP